ncbi:L-threonylcarbamoyladenylate synthase [Roseovarius sp. D22-M7]|uniref:L-threonylcarbamoyladenylate synthase n=1 Tax=Roseovarius sp. D22-M7 TaxID=3127116 RepID=UPI00300FE8C9
MVTTQVLGGDAAGYAAAAAIWRAGGLVAFPTETVYGLGADARDDRAVARIFEAKARPRFNPLIVHVASVAAAQAYVTWSDAAETVARAFWPGPLTLVLPLREGSALSPLVTADLPTLAVRVPGHPVARALLEVFGGPVAAPSANPSGRLSPTEPGHVLAGLDGRIKAVVDGGVCPVGVESTILGLAGDPVLLRPGGVPVEALEAVLGRPVGTSGADEGLSAPGQMRSHYAPGVPVRLGARAPRGGEAMLGFGAVEADLNLSPAGDLTEAAANLFHHLHALDRLGARGIAVSPIPEQGLGRAINDRLRRAAAPRG